jgi:hypothetical protein
MIQTPIEDINSKVNSSCQRDDLVGMVHTSSWAR